MIITFSKNPFIKFQVWFYNNIIYSFKNYYYKHKKRHYQCCVCGEIVAPYFEVSEEEQYNVLTDDYGWHRLDNGKYNRWIVIIAQIMVMLGRMIQISYLIESINGKNGKK